MITADIVKYYVALLIMQYVGKPKAESTIALLCGSLIADQIYTQTRDAFDIETATGKQLEMIGNYVKAYRNVFERF